MPARMAALFHVGWIMSFLIAGRVPWACVRGARACKGAAARGLAVALSLVLSLPIGISGARAAGTTGTTGARGSDVIVINNDRGGVVRKRVNEIKRLRAAHKRVEIRGRICYSSCTMYLGLPDTCVSPDTSFGFHGPSYYGTRLSNRDFEYWSNVIASHYPQPLRRWYLREGRNRISGFYKISGRELIRLGIKPC